MESKLVENQRRDIAEWVEIWGNWLWTLPGGHRVAGGRHAFIPLTSQRAAHSLSQRRTRQPWNKAVVGLFMKSGHYEVKPKSSFHFVLPGLKSVAIVRSFPNKSFHELVNVNWLGYVWTSCGVFSPHIGQREGGRSSPTLRQAGLGPSHGKGHEERVPYCTLSPVIRACQQSVLVHHYREARIFLV